MSDDKQRTEIELGDCLIDVSFVFSVRQYFIYDSFEKRDIFVILINETENTKMMYPNLELKYFNEEERDRDYERIVQEKLDMDINIVRKPIKKR